MNEQLSNEILIEYESARLRMTNVGLNYILFVGERSSLPCSSAKLRQAYLYKVASAAAFSQTMGKVEEHFYSIIEALSQGYRVIKNFIEPNAFTDLLALKIKLDQMPMNFANQTFVETFTQYGELTSGLYIEGTQDTELLDYFEECYAAEAEPDGDAVARALVSALELQPGNIPATVLLSAHKLLQDNPKGDRIQIDNLLEGSTLKEIL